MWNFSIYHKARAWYAFGGNLKQKLLQAFAQYLLGSHFTCFIEKNPFPWQTWLTRGGCRKNFHCACEAKMMAIFWKTECARLVCRGKGCGKLTIPTHSYTRTRHTRMAIDKFYDFTLTKLYSLKNQLLDYILCFIDTRINFSYDRLLYNRLLFINAYYALQTV